MHLNELLKKISLPLWAFKSQSGPPSIRDSKDYYIAQTSGPESREVAAYLVHAANVLPELVEAFRELMESQSLADRIRATSVGQKVEDAEDRLTQAHMAAMFALSRAEEVKDFS